MDSFNRFTNWLFGRDIFAEQEEDEELILLARRHPVLLVRSMAVPFIILMAAVSTAAILLFGEQPDRAGVESVLIPLLGLSSILMLGWLVLAYVEWENDQFVVTTKRVIALRRVYRMSENRHVANVAMVQDVGIKVSGVVAHLFDYGDVSIATGSAMSVVEFAKVPKPAGIKELILHQADSLRSLEQDLRHSDIKERLEKELGYKGLDVGNEAC